jgi:hypothetical protein
MGEIIDYAQRWTRKRDLGQYFTKGRSWLTPAVADFIRRIPQERAFDPFAGGGALLDVAKELGFDTIGTDIDPCLGWTHNDSLVSIPTYQDSFVLTNPPYFYRVAASRMKAEAMKYFEASPHDDLYKIALDVCLRTFDYVVAIVPETFLLHADPFLDRLALVDILTDNPFSDTDHPVCVACFEPHGARGAVYRDGAELGTWRELRAIHDSYMRAGERSSGLVGAFNNPYGNVGFRAIDSTNPDNTVGFCMPEDIGNVVIKDSSRVLVRCSVDWPSRDLPSIIAKANEIIARYRAETADVFLTAYRGNNLVGVRRRRMNFSLSKGFIEAAAEAIDSATLPKRRVA